ncbi:hypothetical protein RINTHH_12000 [Richelia intracellularis HH01]|uniref:Uncharacterized protein n=1 Tax=Richelia intracellularis HH01 TaxID=1165094 RepID=M1X2S9_9NOST|nr:hypothetical protein RINTHH_12000 [Richelia intracellularis HH01]
MIYCNGKVIANQGQGKHLILKMAIIVVLCASKKTKVRFSKTISYELGFSRVFLNS